MSIPKYTGKTSILEARKELRLHFYSKLYCSKAYLLIRGGQYFSIKSSN